MMNISQILFGVGAIFAPMAATWYLSRDGATSMGALLICAGAVFVCWALLAVTSKGRLQKPVGVKRELNLFSVLKKREFLLYAVMVFLYLCYESVAPAYFRQLFLSRGSSEGTANLAISIFWAAMALLRLVGIHGWKGKDVHPLFAAPDCGRRSGGAAGKERRREAAWCGAVWFWLRARVADALCAGGEGIPRAKRRGVCYDDALFHERQFSFASTARR